MSAVATPEERAAWESEVLDFLSWRGAAMFDEWSPGTAIELVRQLGGPDWESVLVLNIVASTAFVDDMQRAVRLASRELIHDRIAKRRIARGRLRGRVLPRETLRARAQRSDPTIWVTETSKRQWQTDANGAIVGFLEHVRRVCSRRLSESSIPTLNAVEAIDRLLTTVPLRHVAPDPAWVNYAMPPWLTAKHEFYRLVWGWADQFRSARRTRDASDLRSHMGGGWLASESRDKLFELFALSHVITALNDGGNWRHFRIASAASASSTFALEAATEDGLTASVRFDRKPPVDGIYGGLLDKYAGVDGRGRRPDLQIAVSRGRRQATTLIEVKATEPNTTYGRDSVVKVFGYLKDFASIWGTERESYPRAALLYSGEVYPKVPLKDRMASDEVILTSASHFRSDVTAIIEAQMRHVTTP